MATLKRALFPAVLFAAALTLVSCGLGRDSGSDGAGGTDPIVAATVNGRPIYVEDVRARAVMRGMMEETEDLDANSNTFQFALEDLIEERLFAMEAEARGIDGRAEVRRQIENARERVLAASIYDEILTRANDPEAVERLYQQYVERSGQKEEVHLRQIVFPTREAADQAKRRLEQGERFEVIAFEQNTSGDGGDLGFREVDDMRPAVRREIEGSSVGSLIGPLEVESQWLLLQFVDRRTVGGQSLETLRPGIVRWLTWYEATQLRERLERDARIEHFRQTDEGMEPGGEVTAPGDAEPVRPTTPQPDANAPPFPFPMGPGGQTPNPAPQAQTQQQAPAPTPPRPQPAAQQQQQQQPAQQSSAQPEEAGGTQ